jgi:predicted nucleic acid-binding protein
VRELPGFVLEASVGMKLVTPEPLSEVASSLLLRASTDRSAIYVPDLFFVECASAIWKIARRSGASTLDADSRLGLLRRLPLVRVATFELVNDALEMAIAHGATPYDSCYVSLGARLQVPVITADQALVRRFARTRYDVLWLADPGLPRF